MSLLDPPRSRSLPDRLTGPAARLSRSWEVLLLGIAVLIFVANTQASPYFLDPWNLSDATFNFTEKAMIAFAMALLIIAGEIDLSVAGIIALASTAMGWALQFGLGTPGLVMIGLAVGLACGAVNGALVTRLGLPSIVVTIGTMSLFRGISYIVLGDQAFNGYPDSFAWLGRGYVVWVISFELVLFLLTGLMSGIAAVCLTARLGSTRPSIASAWELEVVTMVVLGGVSILGGSGSIPGVVLAALVMGMVTFGLGLLNVPGIVMTIFTGSLLIVVIALPILFRMIRERRA